MIYFGCFSVPKIKFVEYCIFLTELNDCRRDRDLYFLLSEAYNYSNLYVQNYDQDNLCKKE